MKVEFAQYYPERGGKITFFYDRTESYFSFEASEKVSNNMKEWASRVSTKLNVFAKDGYTDKTIKIKFVRDKNGSVSADFSLIDKKNTGKTKLWIQDDFSLFLRAESGTVMGIPIDGELKVLVEQLMAKINMYNSLTIE
jgi:hypothetical protein